MWNIPYHQGYMNSGWTYITRIPVNLTGDIHYTGQDITGVRLTFVQNSIALNRTENGNLISYTAEAVIDPYSITGYIPSPNTTFLRHPRFGRFRVVAIDDYGLSPQIGLFYVYLQGDELDNP